MKLNTFSCFTVPCGYSAGALHTQQAVAAVIHRRRNVQKYDNLQRTCGAHAWVALAAARAPHRCQGRLSPDLWILEALHIYLTELHSWLHEQEPGDLKIWT